VARDLVADASRLVFHIAKLNKKRLALIGKLLDGKVQEFSGDEFLESTGILQESEVSIGTLIVALVLAIKQLNTRIDELERKIEDLSA